MESISEEISRGLDEVGVMSMSLDFEEVEVVAFVTLELPAKEMVFLGAFCGGAGRNAGAASGWHFVN